LVNQSKPIVAIFGGSFDPPHKGHQSIVASAIEYLDIDRLILVPTYLNPFKSTAFALASQRLLWCHILFDALAKVCVDAYETKEASPIPTSQSVKHFNIKYQVKYLIIGADNSYDLRRWHDFEWLNSHITWVIVTRKGYEIHTEGLRQYQLIYVDNAISSTQIRAENDVCEVDKKIQKSVQSVLQGKTMTSIDQSVENIIAILDRNKADEIEVFNLEEADYIAKQVIISNSLNGKHTQALAEHLKKGLREKEESILYSDISDDWAVLDLGDILVHIMTSEYRQRYSLEVFLSELLAKQKIDN
jgi:nicotinate-nucleotide adenylyltransferase